MISEAKRNELVGVLQQHAGYLEVGSDLGPLRRAIEVLFDEQPAADGTPTIERPNPAAHEDGWYWVKTFNAHEWVPARVTGGKWALIYSAWNTAIPRPDIVGERILPMAAHCLMKDLISVLSVMYGRGPECIIPETVTTPLGIPVKLRKLLDEANRALKGDG